MSPAETVTASELELSNRIERLEARQEAHERLMDERNGHYTDLRTADQRAVDAALVAQKEKTADAFAANKESVLKAEKGQNDYNVAHNDLTRKMDKQYADTIPRLEAQARFDAMEEKVQEMRNTLSKGHGRDEAVGKAEDRRIEGRGQLIPIVMQVLGWVIAAAVAGWTLHKG